MSDTDAVGLSVFTYRWQHGHRDIRLAKPIDNLESIGSPTEDIRPNSIFQHDAKEARIDGTTLLVQASEACEGAFYI